MSVPFATPEEVRTVARQLADLRLFVQEFVASIDDTVSTAKALEITGIKSRTTLIAERQRDGSLLTFTQVGKRVSYSRASCVAYRLAHQRLAA